MIKQLCILGLASACSSWTWATPPRTQVCDTNGRMIVRIVSRDSVITARAGENGPVYSVYTSAGEQVVPAMPLNALHAKHPGIARNVQSMQAGAWAGLE